MQRQRTRAVIVDGYSTGRELLGALKDRGVECLHLRSSAELPPEVARCFDATGYDADLGYAGPPAEAAEALGRLRPDVLVAGSEWGVTHAETVAALLGLPTNRPALIAARRDKFAMIEAVRAAGLLAANQAQLSCPRAAVGWAAAQARWPVVVKPLASAGSDGLHICDGPEQIEAAFADALHRRNFMGLRNERLLLQSFLSGPQYIVNTVSRDGRAFVTDAWHVALRTLPGSAIVVDETRLLDPAEPRAQELFAYTLAAIAALGIENGAAHSELKWTPEGPALIETGARLMGAAMDRASYRAAGLRTQACQLADALVDPAAFAATRSSGAHYGFTRHLSMLFFIFETAGVVRDLSGLRRLYELPSFHAHYRPLRVGDRVWKTADTFACGGAVYLAHDDRAQIEADIARFRTWERRGVLYDLGDPARAAA